MEKRVYNFSAGPATLPLKVLEEAQRDLTCLPGVGASVMEISHRSKEFKRIIETAEKNLRSLLSIPDNYRVLFLQGGASLQFAMIPMNFLHHGKSADYVLCGSWAKKAIAEAKKVGETRVAWDGEPDGFMRMPRSEEIDVDAAAAYLHITSNETIQGTQFSEVPDTGKVPLTCDASSDILCRPLDISRLALLYAGAQKNAGPAGVTMVVLREDLLERANPDIPQMLGYRVHAESGSLYNTPPTFGVYLLMLVTRWLLDDIGGLENMRQINLHKAALLYDAIDESDGFYGGCAQRESRSMMNVTFRLAEEALESQFIAEAESQDLVSLKGHRSVGGVRASIYNAMPVEGVEKLRDFMVEFRKKNS